MKKTHKVSGVIELVESVGATVLYLQHDNPDLDSIEQMWSKIKAYLRKVKAHTLDALLFAIPGDCDSVLSSDISGWFSACGYSA